jgi:hypothetical protein
MSADRKKYFHAMRQIADAWAERGWGTDMSLDEFVVALVNENPRAFERTLHAGAVAHLGRIDDHLSLMETYLYSIREILRAETAVPRPRDPIADAALTSYHDPGGGLEALDIDGLSAPARRAIRESGCQTPGQLARYGARRLQKFRDIGVTRLDEIRRFLRDRYRLELAD